jgi:hypothetical protein
MRGFKGAACFLYHGALHLFVMTFGISAYPYFAALPLWL